MGLKRQQNCNRNTCPISGGKVAILSDFGKIDPKCQGKKLGTSLKSEPNTSSGGGGGDNLNINADQNCFLNIRDHLMGID